jgi:hypothetical protein
MEVTMRLKKIPPGARHLRTYSELESYFSDFVTGHYPFLWVVGRPGVGKTESIRSAVRGRPAYNRKGGQLTPLQFYLDCYVHRGEPIILDDAEHLLDDRIGGKLVSALGDTSPVKQLTYGSTTRALGEVPAAFPTTSPLCIIANRATAHEAIQSRAVTLFFDPTNLEVHRDVANWFWDQEIHDWFGQHLHRLQPIDIRWYVIADRDKRAGRDWRQIILRARALDRASTVVQDLEVDPNCPTREDKARRFAEIMGPVRNEGHGAAKTAGSRATYFRLRKALVERGQLTYDVVPPIRLRHTTPPAVPSDVELAAMANSPAPPPEDVGPVDLPAHDAFQRPIRGDAREPRSAARPNADDTVAWDRPPTAEDECETDDPSERET